jgi:hypothetical protein
LFSNFQVTQQAITLKAVDIAGLTLALVNTSAPENSTVPVAVSITTVMRTLLWLVTIALTLTAAVWAAGLNPITGTRAMPAPPALIILLLRLGWCRLHSRRSRVIRVDILATATTGAERVELNQVGAGDTACTDNVPAVVNLLGVLGWLLSRHHLATGGAAVEWEPTLNRPPEVSTKDLVVLVGMHGLRAHLEDLKPRL